MPRVAWKPNVSEQKYPEVAIPAPYRPARVYQILPQCHPAPSPPVYELPPYQTPGYISPLAPIPEIYQHVRPHYGISEIASKDHTAIHNEAPIGSHQDTSSVRPVSPVDPAFQKRYSPVSPIEPASQKQDCRSQPMVQQYSQQQKPPPAPSPVLPPALPPDKADCCGCCCVM